MYELILRETLIHVLEIAAPATFPLIQQLLNHLLNNFGRSPNTKLDFLDYQSTSLNPPASYRIHPTKKARKAHYSEP